MEQNRKPFHPIFIAALLVTMAWLLLAPDPLPFGIAVQREMGFIGHLGLFGILAFACAATFPQALWQTSAALLITAVFLEAVQVFIPTRDADPADFAMNCFGILVGLNVFRARVALATRTNRKTTEKT